MGNICSSPQSHEDKDNSYSSSQLVSENLVAQEVLVVGNPCNITQHHDDEENPNSRPKKYFENSKPTKKKAMQRRRADDEQDAPKNYQQTKNSGLSTEQSTVQSTAVSNSSTISDGVLIDGDVLTENLVPLCENLIAGEVLTRMESAKFITHVEAENLRAEKSSYDRNWNLIQMVRKRGSAALQRFITALEETGQQSLASVLHQTYRKTDNILIQTQRIQGALRQFYLESFKKTNPFSLPFTFDIETTWVSLALREEENHQSTEDHAELISRAFENSKMLIIEGKPASGKTSLMRRIAYDWAKGAEQLRHYDLVLYGEFRSIRDKKFKHIVELVIAAVDIYFDEENSRLFKMLAYDNEFLKNCCILILLDGYDESSLENQCEELNKFLSETILFKPLVFNVVLSTRPGYLTKHRGQKGRFIFADVLGFTDEKQKQKYILNHFFQHHSDSPNVQSVKRMLKANESMRKLAETPLFLTLICLVHEKMEDGTLLELYCNIIWWLLDRHQKDFLDRDIPLLFGFEKKGSDKFQIIQDNYLQFPQLYFLGKMAYDNLEKSVFNESNLLEYQLNPIIEHVGLLRKDENRDVSFRRIQEYSFPHRTIQEFLAAVSFCSQFFLSHKIAFKIDNVIQNKNSKLKEMTELQKFIWRIILSKKMSFRKISDFETRQSDFFKKFSTLNLDLDIFISRVGISLSRLNSYLSKCANVESLSLYSSSYVKLTDSIDLFNMANLKHFYLRDSDTQPPPLPLTVACKNFVVFPENEIELHLENICFQPAIHFIESMEYFSKFLNNGSKIELDGVRVSSSVAQKDSYFDVSTKIEFPQESPQITFPTYFADQVLSKALQLISCAQELLFCESKNVGDSLSFDVFTNLKQIHFQNLIIETNFVLNLPNLNKLGFINCTFLKKARINFIENLPVLQCLEFRKCRILEHAPVTIINCRSLNMLELKSCNIDVTAWQSIFTKEFFHGSITNLKLTLDFFKEEHAAEFLTDPRLCDCIKKLSIDCGVNKKFWESIEEKFVSILVDSAHRMKRLKIIHTNGRKVKELDKESIEKAGRKNNIAFKLIQA